MGRINQRAGVLVLVACIAFGACHRTSSLYLEPGKRAPPPSGPAAVASGKPGGAPDAQASSAPPGAAEAGRDANVNLESADL
jgi:hypothetical protein